jgi:hypothetical protein
LSTELGFSDAELDRLESQGVIYDRSEAKRPHFQSA